jgi:hypothetical protein
MTRPATLRLLPLAAMLALAACERAAPEEEPTPERSPAVSPVDRASPDPSPAIGLSPTAPSGSDALPAAFHGRWGLTAADCSTGPSATGLLVIGPQSLEFYESMATLRAVEATVPGSVRASFAFSGEGMSWQREMALSLEQSGRTLVRREYGEDAAPGSFRYRKC